MLCRGTERGLLIQKGNWKIYRCSSCGLGVLDPRPSQEEIKHLYTQEYFADQYDPGLNPDEPAFRKRLSLETHRIRFFRGIKKKGHILDIGCGYGYFLAACREKGYEVSGMDISDWAVKYASRRLGLNVVKSTVEKAAHSARSFDVITMWHFLEHTKDPKAMVSKVGEWLKRDGALVVEVPNYEGTDARKTWEEWVGWQLPHHFYHFTPSALEFLLKVCGFHIVRKKTYHSEVVKTSLRRIAVLRPFARLISRMYEGTSIAVVAVPISP